MNILCSKISKSIGILFRIRDFVPKVCLRILYFCLVHPYFLYCLPVFGATYNTHLQPLILLQKRAIRLISNAAFLANTEPLFKMQKIMKFNDLYKHSIGCTVLTPLSHLSARAAGRQITPLVISLIVLNIPPNSPHWIYGNDLEKLLNS